MNGYILPEGSVGRILGICAFFGKVATASSGRITAHMKIDPARLPRMDVLVRRDGEWLLSPIADLHASDEAIFWPGVLPTFVISEVLVSTSEEQARLAGLARQVSNIALPDAPLGIRSAETEWVGDTILPTDVASGLVLPQEMDAIRGATAMATWAVPRIDPWLNLLTASLAPGSQAQELLPQLADEVDAPWWAFPPWIRVPEPHRPACLQVRLWLAAIHVFRECHSREAVGTSDITSEIAATAARDGSEADSTALDVWTNQTLSVLRADATIDLQNWKTAPVGIAVQLVLTRPEPAGFKAWLEELPALPPAIWWSAATLCGLLHGYRRLDVQFRGTPAQRRLLSLHAVGMCMPAAAETTWPGNPTAAPEWRRQSGNFVFSWSGIDYWSKPEHPRGRWFSADMNSRDVKRAAEDVARRLGWPCLHRDIVLSDDQYTLSGHGRAEVVSEPAQSMVVRGELRMRLPAAMVIEEVLDVTQFRRCVATEGAANVSAPPVPSSNKVIHTRHPEISGLLYASEFLSTAEEVELVASIDQAEWRSDLKRRVQHYGWRYDYKARQIDASMRLGPLPPWARKLAERLAAQGLLPHIADQVIVNEYRGNQGISKHVDCAPCFADGIAMISLLESWEMIFKEERGKRRVPQLLERRSVAVLTGDARYQWSHEIPKRLIEPSGSRRGRRVSVTFRKINEATRQSRVQH